MKVVCTGYGILAPKTINIENYLYNLHNGVCTLEVVDKMGSKNQSNIVGVIREGLEQFESNKRFKRIPRVTQLGMVAAKEALESAKIDLSGKKVGVFFGLSLGATGEKIYQEAVQHVNNGDYKKIPITFSHYANYHSITAAIAHSIGVKGITKSISTGCTSSIEAVEDALLYLKSGKIDVAIVGGTDSSIHRGSVYAFEKTRVLPLNQSLQEGAVPFQEGSKGYAMAEASGVIILEREEDAIKRGASIKGEIVEVISNNDGIDIYSLDESGDQLLAALKEIVKDRHPDYINSQALGIQLNDQIEKRGSNDLFHNQVPYTSIKSMYGNPFGAIGILQVIASLLSVEHNFIPPTIRTTKKGYETMKIVTDTIYQEINEVAITNHGFGGNNACAYIKKYNAHPSLK